MNRKQLIIVDNFYDNVDNVREFVLKQDFNVKGNYPGARTKSFKSEETKKTFEQIIGKKINYWPDTYNGSFQYTTEKMRSWIHRDQTAWAGVLYLTPNAPLEGGTAFFRHKETGIEDKKGYDKLSKEKKRLVDNDGRDITKWHMIDRVSNKYNRLILFRGMRNHSSMQYFGKDKNDGRLFQTWFFNVDENSTVPTISPSLSTTLKLNKMLSKKICVLFFTTSRYEYLIPTLESFHKNVDFGYHEVYKILIDDYPLRRNKEILEKLVQDYKIDKLVLNPENLGYSVTWKNAWNMIPEDTDYVWHQEDDFTFNEKINIQNMITLLHNDKVQLFQVHLKRNIVFENNDFIRNVENNKVGKEMDVGGQKIIVSKSYFNPNPGIYPYWVTKENYGKNLQEGVIIGHLAKKYTKGYSAMLGGRHSKNLITHIGEYTQGKKVLPGEPGWDWLKKYDPTKKYFSAKYLTLYKDDNKQKTIDTSILESYDKAEKHFKNKNYVDAVKYYEKVVQNEKSFNPEKVYWALYSIGLCHEKMGMDFNKVVLYDYLKSFNYRKTRLEGLFKIVCHYRRKGDHKSVFSYGMMAHPVKMTKDKLNVNKSIYDYNLNFEVSISAYYVGFYQTAYDLTKKIMDEKKHPSHWDKLLKSNIKFSEKKLGIKEDVKKTPQRIKEDVKKTPQRISVIKKQSIKAPLYSKKKDKIILIYQFFLHKDEVRVNEMKECLKFNTQNPFIDSIILLNEKIYTREELGVDSHKIKQINLDRRIKFSDVFDYVEKEKLQGYIITCNADIFFDKSLENLYLSGMDRHKIVYGQLRFEYNNKDLYKCKLFGPRNDSQDTWIFHSNYNIKTEKLEQFKINYGVGGCDNRVLYNFYNEGFNIVNDPYFVKTYHNHKAPLQTREWIHKPITPGPYLFMSPYLKNDGLNLFWQYPVITEKTFAIQNKGENNYLGMPWATIIDKNINLQNVYNVLKMKGLLTEKNYYTCCQHVHFRKILPFFKLIGIKKVYSPHKVIGEDEINGINILPCPLYPVNIEDPTRNGKMQGLDLIRKERPFLYSFAGGWQTQYLTDIRPRIFKLNDPKRKDIYIRNTGDWHFNCVVYNSKQNKEGELNEDSVHKQKSQDYLELLLNSRFTLAPSGSGPNSIRFWEALGAGSIPVLLADTLELPKHHLWKEAIVFLPEKDLEKIDDILAEISPEKEKEMRKNCLKLYNYFKTNYANNSDKVIVHYCCGSYDEGAVGGVARYDYHIKCAFPQRIFIKQKDPKLLELCKRYGSRLIVITDNHLACDVPNDITTYLVHHGVAQTHADRDPAWTGFWKNLCCSGQKKMCGYRNPDTTKIISISQFCTDEFTKYYGKTYTRFRNTKILHASELDENRYVTDFNQKPKVLGNWNCVNKGKDIISKIIGIENKFMFNSLQIRILNGDITDFNRRKQDIYLNNDIFLNLSLCEGFSYAALDAVLCGLPLVSTKVGFCYKDMPEDCFVPLEIDRISDCDYILSKLNYAWENRETIGRKGREWYMKNCRFDSWKTKIRNIVS